MAKVQKSKTRSVRGVQKNSGTAAKPSRRRVRTSEENRVELRPDTVFQVQLGVSMSEVDEELILGDVLRNRYFRVNRTGAFIWRRASNRSPFQEIVQAVAKEYALDPSEAKAAVSRFLTEVIQTEILVNSTDDEPVGNSAK